MYVTFFQFGDHSNQMNLLAISITMYVAEKRIQRKERGNLSKLNIKEVQAQFNKSFQALMMIPIPTVCWGQSYFYLYFNKLGKVRMRKVKTMSKITWLVIG